MCKEITHCVLFLTLHNLVLTLRNSLKDGIYLLRIVLSRKRKIKDGLGKLTKAHVYSTTSELSIKNKFQTIRVLNKFTTESELPMLRDTFKYNIKCEKVNFRHHFFLNQLSI